MIQRFVYLTVVNIELFENVTCQFRGLIGGAVVTLSDCGALGAVILSLLDRDFRRVFLGFRDQCVFISLWLSVFHPLGTSSGEGG